MSPQLLNLLPVFVLFYCFVFACILLMDNTSRILTVIAFYRILLHEAGVSGTFGPTGTEAIKAFHYGLYWHAINYSLRMSIKSVQFYYDKCKTDLS